MVERISRDVESERTALRIAVGINGGKVTLPSLEERLAAFDAALAEEPKKADADDELLRALGVR